MTTLIVVEDLDMFEDCRCCMDSGCEGLMEYQFRFQSGKEALSDGIVPAVSPPAHALDAPMFLQLASENVACVLAAAVRVRDYRRSTPSLQTHPEGVQDQISSHVVRHRPAHYHSGVEVDEGAQEKPTLRRWDVGYIAHPDLVRLFGRKLPFKNVRRNWQIVF